MADGRAPDRRRAHHTAQEPSPWEIEVYNDHIGGQSYRQLAERHDCHHSHIGNVIKRVIEWKRPQLAEHIRNATQDLIDKHLHAYEEAMRAWQESRGQLVKETITTQKGRKDRQGNELGDEVKTERRYSSGDPRHLATAIKALKEYRAIIGYRPPSPDDDNDERVAGKTFSDVIDRELARLEEIKVRQLGKPSTQHARQCDN